MNRYILLTPPRHPASAYRRPDELAALYTTARGLHRQLVRYVAQRVRADLPARPNLLNSHRSPSGPGGPPRAYIDYCKSACTVSTKTLQIHLIQADKIGFTESEEVKNQVIHIALFSSWYSLYIIIPHLCHILLANKHNTCTRRAGGTLTQALTTSAGHTRSTGDTVSTSHCLSQPNR